MSYLDRIKQCYNFNSENYLPFVIDDTRYGWIRQQFAEHLKTYDKVFDCNNTRVCLHRDLKSYQQRTATVNEIIEELHQKNIIDTWVGETYPICTEFEQDPVMEVERSSVLYLGLLGFGVHINGLVETNEGTDVWLATRSLDKPFNPGALDQMVAGGQPLGIGLSDNIIKESAEEANVPSDIASKAMARGSIHYEMETERGLDCSTIFIYDMWLPDEFDPENTDGEVDSFQRVPIAEVARLTDETTLFKENCNLVNIDLLIRSGLIDNSHPDFKEMTSIIYKN